MSNTVQFRSIDNGDIIASKDELVLGAWSDKDAKGSYRISSGVTVSEANNAWGTVRDLTGWIYLMISFGGSKILFNSQTN